MPFAATWMEIILLNDVVKDKNMISLICGILKNDTNEHIYKEETDSHRKQTYDYHRGEVEEGINQELVISKYKLLYVKHINNKVLLHSIGNYIQYLAIHYSGKEFEKEYAYMYIFVYVCAY